MNRTLAVLTVIVAAAVLAGCATAGRSPMPLTQNDDALTRIASTGKITHIVYVVQNGRSFDTLFQGYPGADTVASGKIHTGKRVELQRISLRQRFQLGTFVDDMFLDCNGTGNIPGTQCKMDGFDLAQGHGPKGIEYPAYVYVGHSDTKPYFAMAHEWALGDEMFASQLDTTFEANQYLIAAQDDDVVDLPSAGYGCAGKYDVIETITAERKFGKVIEACFNYKTLGDEFDEAGLSWRYYTAPPGNTGYRAIEHFFDSAGWRRHIVLQPSRFLTDVAHGKLADFSWVTPTCGESDDASCGRGGPAWVASVVNAVGESKYWNSTAIVVQWSDWGGFYDHVAPKFLSADSLGFRVPLLVISPYARHGHVSHVQYETASVLRFAEDTFGLQQLSIADRRATSPAADCLDFNQKPRTFVPIKMPKGGV